MFPESEQMQMRSLPSALRITMRILVLCFNVPLRPFPPLSPPHFHSLSLVHSLDLSIPQQTKRFDRDLRPGRMRFKTHSHFRHVPNPEIYQKDLLPHFCLFRSGLFRKFPNICKGGYES